MDAGAPVERRSARTGERRRTKDGIIPRRVIGRGASVAKDGDVDGAVVDGHIVEIGEETCGAKV